MADDEALALRLQVNTRHSQKLRRLTLTTHTIARQFVVDVVNSARAGRSGVGGAGTHRTSVDHVVRSAALLYVDVDVDVD